MEKNIIGQYAGIVWNYLDKRKETTITELKMATNLHIKDVYLALGWLARENKIFFWNDRGELLVSLIY